MRVVATIGTTHPYASTGLLLEMAALRALGVRPVAVIAGVSAQDAGRVLVRKALDAATIDRQFAALEPLAIDACSVGALLDAGSVHAVAQNLRRLRVPVVCDPVIAASGGDRLADDATVGALRDDLASACTLIAPNLGEAALLTGRSIRTLDDVRGALEPLLALGPAAVLVTGGHLAGDPCDVLADRTRVVEFRAPRIDGDLRGTGSLLCAGIAARLAGGDSLEEAVRGGRDFVRERYAHGVTVAGMRVAY